jgi:hypothetical protein
MRLSEQGLLCDLPEEGEVRWRSYYFAGERRIAMCSFGEGQGETEEAV